MPIFSWYHPEVFYITIAVFVAEAVAARIFLSATFAFALTVIFIVASALLFIRPLFSLPIFVSLGFHTPHHFVQLLLAFVVKPLLILFSFYPATAFQVLS